MSVPSESTNVIAAETLPGLDYPFEDPKEGLKFMESLETSGLVSKEQFEMICSGNAKKLLRI